MCKLTKECPIFRLIPLWALIEACFIEQLFSILKFFVLASEVWTAPIDEVEEAVGIQRVAKSHQIRKGGRHWGGLQP